MPPACKYCRKKFTSGAALNFHIKKAHQNEPAAPCKSSTDKKVEQDNPQSPGLCRMIKFGKLKGLPDPLTGPFRLFNDVKTESRLDLSLSRTRPKPILAVSPSAESVSAAAATATISNPTMKKKNDDDNDDDDLTVIGAVPPPQPSTSKRAKRTRGRKRTKLSEDLADTSVISSGNLISDAEESFGPSKTSNDLSTSSIGSIGTPNKSLDSISASATEDDDDIHSQSALSSAGSFTSLTSIGTRTSWDSSNLPQVTIRGKVQPCPICGQSGFKNSRQYAVHLEIHQGLRPFPCPYDGCGCAYETDLQLLEHVSMKHSKEAVFECERCGSTFKTRAHLKRHTRCKQ